MDSKLHGRVNMELHCIINNKSILYVSFYKESMNRAMNPYFCNSSGIEFPTLHFSIRINQ